MTLADLERKFAAAEAAHAREIADLKAQLRAMKGSVVETKAETRRIAKTREAVVVPPPSAPLAIPPGATPMFVTAEKRMQYGALTVTPGGFLAAESVFRNHANGNEISTSFGGIPFANSPAYHANEFRPTARQSRLALLVEAQVTPTFLLAGYLEGDFIGAAPTANSNQTNSYNPRIRNLYATLDALDYGFHVLAGQSWSLVTLNSKGITPRNEVLPPTIDASQMPGSLYARQAQIRVTKDFDKKLWFSLSAEESETTFNPGCGTAGIAPGLTPTALGGGVGGVSQITCGTVGTGGAYSSTTNYSLNHVPDVVGKVAYEARLADRDVHLEAFGIYRDLYDRVTYANGSTTNLNTAGYGGGAGIIVPIIPRRLDFQINGIYGRGVGRYGPGQLADATFAGNGSLRPLTGTIALTGLTFHATPSLDFYAFAGLEKQFRAYGQNANGTYYGTGYPGGQVDTGCATEGSAATTCNGATRQVYQLTTGVWDKLYKGNFGEVRAGLEYTYTNRQIYNSPGLAQPHTDVHALYTSLRYYPFQ